MDWSLFWTIIGVVFGATVSTIGIISHVIRNFKTDIKSMLAAHEARFEIMENRIFQLAMGKSLKEILQEERK